MLKFQAVIAAGLVLAPVASLAAEESSSCVAFYRAHGVDLAHRYEFRVSDNEWNNGTSEAMLKIAGALTSMGAGIGISSGSPGDRMSEAYASTSGIALDGGLSTMDSKHDASEREAQIYFNLMDLLQQARHGDGPGVRSFTKKIASDAAYKDVTAAQVARAVAALDDKLAFCSNPKAPQAFAEFVATVKKAL